LSIDPLAVLLLFIFPLDLLNSSSSIIPVTVTIPFDFSSAG